MDLIYKLLKLLSRFKEAVKLHKGHFIRGILIGFAISVVVTIMAWLGHFRPYDNLLTDFLQSTSNKKANDVALLFITEAEYKQGFKSISPLSRNRLADTIEMLVKLKARVIAMDIDISDPTPEDQRLSDALTQASKAGIHVIVTANFTEIENKDKSNDNSNFERPYTDESLHFTNEGFVLFEDATPGSQWTDKVMYGGVDFRMDNDGIFRRAEPLYMINDVSADKNSHHPVPSLPIVMSAAYLGMSGKDLEMALSNIHENSIELSSKGKQHHDEIHIHIGRDGRITPNFIGNYEHFDREVSLTRLLEDYGPGKAEGVTIFRDKIVIIGGTYDKKDFYLTPVGRMSGMEIQANITQNILNHNLINHTNFWKAFIIEVFLGALVALAFILTTRFWAFIICLITIIPVVIGASLLSFAASYYWFDFIPTIAGVFLHGLISKVEHDIKTMKHKRKDDADK